MTKDKEQHVLDTGSDKDKEYHVLETSCEEYRGIPHVQYTQ